jgi:2'-5' RNA ligase
MSEGQEALGLPDERRTGLLVPVPAGALVDDFRGRHLAASVARGIPPHVTVLFPFALAADWGAELRAQVASHFSAFAPFAAELTQVGRFEAYVWLKPDPHDRFIQLISATCARFPQFPPYGNAFVEPIPHLTIAEIQEGDTVERIAELAEHELGPQLPFRFEVDSVGLFEELVDGTWRQSDSFELG